MNRSVILCVDDDKTVLNALEQQLSRAVGRDAIVEIAENSEEALDLIDDILKEGSEIALVISDHLMPGMKGDEFLIEVHNRLPGAFTILLTGQASMEAVRNAINRAQLYRYITKPWEDADMILTVREAFHSYVQRGKLALTEQQNSILRKLNETLHLLTSEFNLTRQKNIFLQKLQEYTDFDKIYLFLTNNNGTELKSAVSSEPAETEILKERLRNDKEALLIEVSALLEKAQFATEHDFIFKIPLRHANANAGFLLVDNSYSRVGMDGSHRELIDLLSANALEAFEKGLLYSRLEEQNRIISEKNSDITESIQYAGRLQTALQPPPQDLEKFFPESFIWYQPKDILSGDFFWHKNLGTDFFIAAADCTGHGIPGALMAVLGATLLSEIVIQQNIIFSDMVLNELHRRITNTFHQANGDHKIMDGMDVAFCRIDMQNKTIEFAGANRPILIASGEIGTLYEPDKLPIGHQMLDESAETIHSKRKFKAQEINYRSGDMLYLFSDGVTDQFGGDNLRKFSKKRFVELLIDLSPQAPGLQKQKILDVYETWRNGNTQLDDIMVIGIRLP